MGKAGLSSTLSLEVEPSDLLYDIKVYKKKDVRHLDTKEYWKHACLHVKGTWRENSVEQAAMGLLMKSTLRQIKASGDDFCVKTKKKKD